MNRESSAEKLADAWIQTALEYDRSLLVVASAGLGLIATLADKSESIGPVVAIALVTGALAFTSVIVAVLAVFQFNKNYLAATEKSESEIRWSRLLKALDAFLAVAFLVGIVSVTVATTFLIKDKDTTHMSGEYSPDEIVKMAERGEVNPGMESLDGVKAMLRNQTSRQVEQVRKPQLEAEKSTKPQTHNPAGQAPLVNSEDQNKK